MKKQKKWEFDGVRLSVRTWKALFNAGIKTQADYAIPRYKLVRIRNLGLKSFNEAERVIAKRKPVNQKEYLRLLSGSRFDHMIDEYKKYNPWASVEQILEKIRDDRD